MLFSLSYVFPFGRGYAQEVLHEEVIPINSGSSLESCKRTIELTEKYSFVYGSLGIHPCDTAELTEEDMDWLARQSHTDKCVAIGEIGLDYYWVSSLVIAGSDPLQSATTGTSAFITLSISDGSTSR